MTTADDLSSRQHNKHTPDSKQHDHMSAVWKGRPLRPPPNMATTAGRGLHLPAGLRMSTVVGGSQPADWWDKRPRAQGPIALATSMVLQLTAVLRLAQPVCAMGSGYGARDTGGGTQRPSLIQHPHALALKDNSSS